ncbi:MAG: efflux RND transporter periplasmic adaptor subunit, partial [Candidatus Rokuibacteriota bacterium]
MTDDSITPDHEPLVDGEAHELDAPRRSTALRVILGAIAAVGLLGIGAAGAVMALRQGFQIPGVASLSATPPASPSVSSAGAPMVGGSSGPSPAKPLPVPPASAASPPAEPGDVEIVLTSEALARLGLKTARVDAVEARSSVQVPGTVTPHGYREVKVTPIASGIVRAVHAELGAAVRRGTPLATLFSTDLADAQTKYLSMAAMVDADHKKVVRTQKLAEIGAASQQELEEVTAVHTSHATELEAARLRLMLLGLSREHVATLVSPTEVVSEIVVPAPIDGIVTGRTANLGQVVGMGQELFVVTDLSEVWVVGDLYEQDFASVGVGSETVVTAAAYPGLSLRGRVAYVDPRVDPGTRTAKVRVEVPNADGRLRLGMYVSLAFTTRGGARTLVVPRSAVQVLGERHVVYLPAKGDEGKFVQRRVTL